MSEVPLYIRDDTWDPPYESCFPGLFLMIEVTL